LKIFDSLDLEIYAEVDINLGYNFENLFEKIPSSRKSTTEKCNNDKKKGKNNGRKK